MIYVSSACVRNNYISETIEQYANAGIKNIELSGGTKYYEGIESDLVQLRKKYGLNYVCHAYFPPPKEDIVVNLAACNDNIYRKSIKHYENCIEMLKRLEIKTLSIHAGFLVEVTTEEIGKKISNTIIYDEYKAYDRFVSAYQYIDGLCKKEDIEFYLENNVFSLENYESFEHNNYFMMTDSQSIEKMRKDLEFKLLLDLGHLHVSTNTLNLDFEQECEKLGKQAKWIHLSHNNGYIDQHLALNEGSNILKKYNYIKNNDTNVTLETAGDMSEILESIQLIQ